MNKKKLFGKMFHKKQAYQVVIVNEIQNDMEDEDGKAFVEKYPDGKLLTFDTFSEMRDFYNQIKNDLPDNPHFNFWYAVDIQLSDNRDVFLAVVYEGWSD